MSKIHLAAGILRGAATMPMQLMNQVHGTKIVEVFAYGDAPEADALVTRVPGLRIAVKTADCIPLIMADETAGIAAAVHAGWRGLTADIIPKVLARLVSLGADPARLKVLVGPSLGVECAEFSDPLREIPAKFHWAIRERRVNLNGIARRQLEEAGVQHIEWKPLCTRCNTEWPSWRRDKTSERFFTWIELASPAPSH
ncbi:MAG: polyphenol oxidase family protein [Patescibacteria group bacterium]